jgi:hypothetical protein
MVFATPGSVSSPGTEIAAAGQGCLLSADTDKLFTLGTGNYDTPPAVPDNGSTSPSFGTCTVDWASLFPDDNLVSSMLSSNLQVDNALALEPIACETAVSSISLPLSLSGNAANTSAIRINDLQFLIDLFLQRLRPSMPFFKPSYLLNNLKERQIHDRAFNALLHAIGALTLFQPMQSPDKDFLPDRTRRGKALLEEAVQLHSRPDLGESPVIEDVLTSVFLFACQFCLGNHNAARFRLQEAMRLGETMHLHSPMEHGNVSVDEQDRRLRTLLCLTVIEKYVCRNNGFHRPIKAYHWLQLTCKQGLLHSERLPSIFPLTDRSKHSLRV